MGEVMLWVSSENQRKKDGYYEFNNINNLMKHCYMAFCGARPMSHFMLKSPKHKCCRACSLMALYRVKR